MNSALKCAVLITYVLSLHSLAQDYIFAKSHCHKLMMIIYPPTKINANTFQCAMFFYLFTIKEWFRHSTFYSNFLDSIFFFKGPNMTTEKSQPPVASAPVITSCRRKKSDDTTFLEDVKDHIDEFINASMDEHKTCFQKTISKVCF